MFASPTEYHGSEPYNLVVFDIRYSGVAQRLHRGRALWQERSDIEALDQNHYVLLVWPSAGRSVR